MRSAAQLVLTVLLNAAWQVALVTIFALVCNWLLRGTAARYRHLLWVGALLVSFLLPVLSSSNLGKTAISSPERLEPLVKQPVVTTRIISPDVEPIDEPLSEPGGATEPARRSSFQSGIRVNQNLAGVLIGLYAVFLLYRFTNLVRAWLRTRAIVRRAYEFNFLEPHLAIIRECQRALGVSRVKILCSSLVPVPITVGTLRPLIILPERLLHDLNEELLKSAIGHELAHVRRRDYLFNLIYEFIYLPLSFHPAAALIRRRIKRTRELCCDESVAARLLRPEVYARSLVHLIGSVPVTRRLAENTTIGITESDNLEARIMLLLNTPRFTPRHKTLLLVFALLLLAVPCAAGATFALTLNIDQPELAQTALPQSDKKLERRSQDQAIEELKRQASQLEQRMQTASAAQRREIEARLIEVQRNLEEHLRLIQQYEQQKSGLSAEAEARLWETQRNLEQHERALQEYYKLIQTSPQKMREAEQRYAEILKAYPQDEARMKEARDKLAQLYGEVPELEARLRESQRRAEELQQSKVDRKVRLIHRVEPEYPQDAREKGIEGTVQLGMTIDHQGLPQNIVVKRSVYPSIDQAAIEAARKMRFEPGIKNGEPASMVITVEFDFRLESKRQQELEERVKTKDRQMKERSGNVDREVEQREKLKEKEMKERSGGEESEMKEREKTEVAESEVRVRKERLEQKRSGGLTAAKWAKISMAQAIQIATSKYPGTVLQSWLFGEREDKVFYNVVIANGDEVTYVCVSAIDGQILTTEKEKRRQEQQW
ncbi:MAG: TonB family protein [Acidobacteriota bacterium]